MEKTLSDYLTAVRSKLWLIVLFVFISCATTFYVTQTFVKPVYQAESQLLVSGSSLQGANLNEVTMNLNLVESYKEIIKSDKIINTVVEAHPEFGLTANELRKKLNVSSVDKTQIIELAVVDGDYTKAAKIANTIALTSINEIRELMNMNNIKLLYPAKSSDLPDPVNSSMAMNLIVSFMVSLMAALGVVVLLENVDDRLRTEKEVEHYVGLPVLVTIGTIKDHNSKQSKILKGKVGEQPYVVAK